MAGLSGVPFIIVVGAAAGLLALGWHLARILLLYRGVATRRSQDASALGLVPDRQLGAPIAALVQAGFRRLGEVQIDLPNQRLVQLGAGRNRGAVGPAVTRYDVFVMVDPSGAIVAETGYVAGLTPMVGLTTHFADGTVVETMYPRGESIHDPDFHSGDVSTSVAAAYEEQRLEVDRWRTGHGSPRAVEGIADYLRNDVEYRVRFARRKLRRPLLRYQLLPAAVIGVVLIAGAAWILSRWTA